MSNNKKLGMLTLSLMCIASVLSLRNLPMMASAGMQLVFFYGLAGIGFFLPSALLVAELSTLYPQEGGLYLWIKEAFGPKVGFLAVWLLAGRYIACFPPMLAFASGTLAYLIDPRLAESRLYTASASIVLFWIMTFVMLKGPQVLKSLGSLSTFLGTLLPAALLLSLSTYWLMKGNKPELDFNLNAIVPNLKDWAQIAFLSGAVLSLGGIEVGGIYAKEVNDPRRTLPKATFLAAILVFIVLLVGSLAVALIVPSPVLSLNSGIIQTFSYIFNAFNIPQATFVMGGVIIFGTLSILGLCILTPAVSLGVAAKQGFLPPYFHKTNQNGVPTRIVFTQGVVITLFCLTLLILPSTNTGFWAFSAIAASTYLLVYIMLFAAGIALRIKYPSRPRAFAIPGGLLGIGLVCGLGLISSVVCFLCGFIPPTHLDANAGSLLSALQVGGVILLCLPACLLFYLKKPSWKGSSKPLV